MDLPFFRYHPDPLATGAVVPSDGACRCCGESRGYIYTGPVYSEHHLENALCPWCIADGRAFDRFNALFADDYSLSKASVPAAVIAEVTLRTPGYTSWQSEQWLAHCGDACAFRGDITRERLAQVSFEAVAELMRQQRLEPSDWSELVKHYTPGGDPAIYLFVCLHCSREILGIDFS
jgi:uncharacterized protein CbrC (UPF0167 family)